MARSTVRSLALIAVLLVALVALTGCSGADASKQGRIEVGAAGTFSPSTVVVKAGSPVELAFGPGGGCTAGVAIPSLGIPLTDLTQGGAVVPLPALQPGRHPLICQSNMVMGELVVE